MPSPRGSSAAAQHTVAAKKRPAPHQFHAAWQKKRQSSVDPRREVLGRMQMHYENEELQDVTEEGPARRSFPRKQADERVW